MIHLDAGTLLLGALLGLTYGQLAVGLVLVYRANRIINFAHGQIGAFAASALALAVLSWHVPFWLALLPALLVGAATGAGAEVLIVRRLRRAPRLMSVIATLGLGQFLLLFALAINPQASTGITFPKPPGFPALTVGGLYVSPSYVAMAVLVPVAVAALLFFLERTRYGLGIRAAEQNPDAARLSGLSTSRMSSLAWGIAGALSSLTAILVIPTQGAAAAASFGPSLLLRALAAAVLGRLTSIPIALAAGIGLGVVESVVSANTSSFGFVDVVLFVIILVAAVLRAPRGGREGERSAWAAVTAWPPLPEAVRNLPRLRWARRGALGVLVALLLAVPAVFSNVTSFRVTVIISAAIVGLSVGIVSGLAGQLSLGQLAIAGVGAAGSYQVYSRTDNFPLAVVAAGVTAAVASVLLGLPALRVRGHMLAVTTLAFALAAQEWLLRQPFALGGSGVSPGHPRLGGFTADTARSYYLVALALAAVATWLAWNARRGGFGRLLVAVRDDEAQARAFGITAWRVKLEAYAVSGFIAGLGGAALGQAFSTLSYSNFPTDSAGDPSSIGVVAMTVLGGIGLLGGPFLGALYIIGVPRFLPLDNAGLAASSFGWLLLLLYSPGGLAGVARPIRDRIVRAIVGELPAEAAPNDAPDTTAVRLEPRAPSANGTDHHELVLSAQGLRKSYGGISALSGVTLEVRQGEVLGLIGANGAGKTTLFEVLSGFTVPDEGTVLLDGIDCTGLSPERRAHKGLVRSFQNASLFPTLSVLDTVQLAFERLHPTDLATALTEGISARDREIRARARDLVQVLGLERWRDVPVAALSTGTRRMTELACIVALEPKVLLLDEPSSGIAQRESEALGEVLLGLRRHLDATFLVIEHDMPMLSGIADRMVAMESGRVIAVGTAADVLSDAGVIDSYLGGDRVAVQRSGKATVTARTPRPRTRRPVAAGKK